MKPTTEEATASAGDLTPADPIFAAIDAHRDAEATYQSAIEAHIALLDSLPEHVTGHARVRIGTTKDLDTGESHPKFAYSHREISEEFEARMRPAHQSALKKLRERRGTMHVALQTVIDRHAKLQDEHGLTAASAAQKAASNAASAAFQRLFEVMPTTVAGVLALVRYLRTILNEGSNEDAALGHRIADAVEHALTRIAA